MSIAKLTKLKWFTTPQELRELAFKMESKIQTARLDESTYVDFYGTGPDILEVHFDQQRVKNDPRTKR